jgi:hypothetical protein
MDACLPSPAPASTCTPSPPSSVSDTDLAELEDHRTSMLESVHVKLQHMNTAALNAVLQYCDLIERAGARNL